MASNGSSRKRNHRSKAGAQNNKNNTSLETQTQNQRSRDAVFSQQQKQQNQNNTKQIQDNQNQQINKQQQQQQQQHQQQQQQQRINRSSLEAAAAEPESTAINSKLSSNTTSIAVTAPTTIEADNGNISETIDKKTQHSTSNLLPDNLSTINLHTAIFWRRLDIVESLLQNGAKAWDVDQQEKSAFRTACQVGDLDIVKTLWESAHSSNNPSKLDLKQADKEGDTVFHACAVAGDEEMCRFLISKSSEIICTKNKCGETPLHLASKCDHMSICNLLLKSVMASASGCDQLHRLVLEENERGQTAICVSILYQHAQITRILLDVLDTQQQATYLSNRFNKVLNESQQICYSIHAPSVQHAREVFLHGLLISVSVVLIRLSERLRLTKTSKTSLDNKQSESRLDICLTNTDIISILVRVACNSYMNKQIVQIACFLLIFLVEGVLESSNAPEAAANTPFQTASQVNDNQDVNCEQNSQRTGMKFLQQFLNGNGPNSLLLKVSELEVNEPSDAVSMITLALPVVSLVRSEVGTSWLVSNRSHLTFLKEIILHKRPVLDLLTTTCPLLPLSHLEAICQDFVRLVEATEARDREQNLAELLMEEERDRKRRERKKRKHKNQSILEEVKNDGNHTVPQLLDISSEEEVYECLDDTNTMLMDGRKFNPHSHNERFCATTLCAMSEGLSKLTQETKGADSNDPTNKVTKSILNTGDEIEMISSNDFLSCSARQHQAITEYVELKGAFTGGSKVMTKRLANNVDTRSNAMRWADVAKIGCSNSDKDMNYQDHSALDSSRNIPGKTSSCEWPESVDMENVSMKNKRLAYGETNADRCEFNHNWFNVINPYSIEDTPSDNDSSQSSSSSFESPSSLVSDPYLYAQTVSWTSRKDKHEPLSLDKLCDNAPERLRKKRKLKQIPKSDKDVTVGHCWDTSCDSIVDKLVTSSAAGGIPNVDLKLPVVSDLLLRTRSDNILHFPSRVNVEKKSPSGQISDCLPNPKHPNQKVRESAKNIPRQENVSTLPPLKLKELDRLTPGTYEIGSHKKLIEGHARSKLLSAFKTSGDSILNCVNILDHETFSSVNTNSVNINNEFLGSELSRSNPLAPLHSDVASNLQSQYATFTPPPPPGFQAIITTGSSKNMAGPLSRIKHMTALGEIEKSENLLNNSANPSRGTVITTVLLDKVKNPPLSLQQNTKVPSLSILAWNCGQESKLSWSKLLDSKPTTTIASLLSKRVVTGGQTNRNAHYDTTPANENDCKAPACPNHSAQLGHAVSIPVKGSVQYSTTSLKTFPTFSTILMNRIQKRSQHRNSVFNKDPPICVASSISPQKTNHSSNPCSEHKSNVEQRTNAIEVDTSTSSVNKRAAEGSIDTNSTQKYVMTDETDVGYADISTPYNDDKEMEGNVGNSFNKEKHGNMFNQQPDSDNNNKQTKGQQNTLTDSRSFSPPVYFPERIRDDSITDPSNSSNFPAFHDVQTSDFLSEMFSDPLFSDNIAISQIRQKILFNPTNQSTQQDGLSQAHEVSDIDLDYYASIYQMRFRDVLCNRPGQTQGFLASRNGVFMNKQGNLKDSREWSSNQNVFGVSSLSTHQTEHNQTKRPNVRWNRPIQKMLDLLWTTRQQYGNIVLPQSIPDFSIGMAGSALLLLGLLMDKTEVAVFVLDKSLGRFVSRIVDVMSNPDVDRYFLMQCKSFSESASIQYLAVELYEYTLCEYLQLYLPTCNHTQEAYTGLVWQLLQALAFLHHKLGVPHGYLAPCWVFINREGNLRLASFGVTAPPCDRGKPMMDGHGNIDMQGMGYDYRSSLWRQNDDQNVADDRGMNIPSFFNDICAAGKLACFILTKGQHLFGMAPLETEINFLRDHLSSEAFDLISPMFTSDPKNQPSVEQSLKHPIFWSADKRFRLILIVGSDVLTEMKTGVALTGTGAPTMMEILSLIDINMVSPNWIHQVDSTVLKEMRSFRVYKNNLAELTLFVYNCCLHFDKLSNIAKEVLDDPCKYFQNLFPGLFMAIFRSLKSSDRIDRTCYKPFF